MPSLRRARIEARLQAKLGGGRKTHRSPTGGPPAHCRFEPRSRRQFADASKHPAPRSPPHPRQIPATSRRPDGIGTSLHCFSPASAVLVMLNGAIRPLSQCPAGRLADWQVNLPNRQLWPRLTSLASSSRPCERVGSQSQRSARVLHTDLHANVRDIYTRDFRASFGL